MATKTLVCLANSKKLSARCVAGVEHGTETWIRPIGSGDHGAVTFAEQRLEDGSRPDLLDLIEMELGEAAPQPGQPENWRLSDGQWKKVGQLEVKDARELLGRLATDEPVFGTNERSVSVGDVQAGKIAHSLAVVQPEGLTWEKRRGFSGGTQIRGKFTHAGQQHDLPLTDPVFLGNFVDYRLGEYPHSGEEDVFLVLSLGEPMNEEHWKLIAGVVTLPV